MQVLALEAATRAEALADAEARFAQLQAVMERIMARGAAWQQQAY